MSETLQIQSLSLEEYQARLEAIIRSFGFSFTLSTDVLAQNNQGPFERPERVSSGYAGRGKFDGVSGQTDGEDMTVVIRDDLSPLDIARTTTHELAHIVLGHSDAKHQRDDALPLLRLFGLGTVSGIFESEAESCAYSVLAQFGFADLAWSENYIDGWMGHVPGLDAITDSISKNAARGAFKILQLINSSAS